MTYDMIQTAGGWAIVDQNGVVAVVNGTALVGLDIEDADDLVDLLNTLAREAPAQKH